MVQSVARRERLGKPDLVVIDEAHHARAKTWETVLGRWPNARNDSVSPQRQSVSMVKGWENALC